MTQLLRQMMIFPLETFVSSIEILTKTLQSMRSIADQSVDIFVSSASQTLARASGDPDHISNQVTVIAKEESFLHSQQELHKEEVDMWDNLGGDDLKIVRYSIIFDKPDEEKILKEEQQDLLDYSTDGGSYGGLKIAEFFKKNPQVIAGIAEKDQRYVRFVYRVVQRIPKGTANYEKRKVELLRDISEKIG